MENTRIAYPEHHFRKQYQDTVYAAQTILSLVQELLPRIDSAVDSGCGVGTWLSVLKERGTPTLLGIDGCMKAPSLLQIPPADFHQQDLTEPHDLGRRFDLAISLEVAEHLPPKCAQPFVAQLAKASDFVLFSAAIPGQGGVHHLNEQWIEYWCDLFAPHGYSGLDLFRKRIWHDQRIPVYYRQNIILFAKNPRIPELGLSGSPDALKPVSMVHPEKWTRRRRAKKKKPGAF